MIFLGKQGQVHESFSVADLMLLPSELESFGLAALEAMACEVPSVATRVGGVPEVIDDGKTGLLTDVGDIETMSQRAIALLSDEGKLRQMGKRARIAAQTRFCSTKIIPEYERFFPPCWSGLRQQRRQWPRWHPPKPVPERAAPPACLFRQSWKWS